MNDKIYSANTFYDRSNLSLVNSSDKIKMTGFPIVSNTSNKINGNKNDLESNTNFRYENQKGLWSSLNGKNLKLALMDRKKRKKFKEPGVVNEYPASAIPNNIGDKPVEVLADYVNGSSTKNSGKTLKPERKLKTVTVNRKHEKDKNNNNINQEKNNNSAISGLTVLNRVDVNFTKKTLEPINHELVGFDDRINSTKRDDVEKKTDDQVDFTNDSVNEDEDFYQIVRHKTRNKTKILKPPSALVELSTISKNNDKLNSKFQGYAIDQTVNKISENLSTKAETINLNDKVNLNWFIYHLWIEFQKNRDKYLQEQNDQTVRL